MSISLAIVPIREFESAKLRLSSSLSPVERSKLSVALINRTLSSIEKSEIDHVSLVCSDPESVHDLRSVYRKLTITKESIRHGGVNSAMVDGLNVMKTRFDISETFLLPSDLPLLSSAALNEIISMLQEFDLVINPSKN